EARKVAVLAYDRMDNHVRPKTFAVLADTPGLLFEAALRGCSLQSARRQPRRPVTLRVEAREMLPYDFIAGIALYALGSGVPAGHDPIWIERVKRILGHAFQKQAE